MELRLKLKSCGAIYTCVPAFVNMHRDGRLIVEEAGREVLREMKNYDVYIKPHGSWTDLTYAQEEGFLDPNQLRNWP